MTDLFPSNVFRDPKELREFLTAGNAKVSVRSEKTLRHYTYKIRKSNDGKAWFVHRLGGGSQYHYLGTIRSDNHFTHTHKSVRYDWIIESYTAFAWLWKYIAQGIMPTNVTVWHEGRCGACGKELTDPSSIRAGYGPDCRRARLRHGMMYDRKTV